MTIRKPAREVAKPKKIVDSDQRKALQQAVLEESRITARVFDLVDTYLNRKASRGFVAKNERAPDWLRPIAALSLRLGVEHEAIRDAVKAGQRSDWVTVDMLLMAYQN